jgi:hypothetical protein
MFFFQKSKFLPIWSLWVGGQSRAKEGKAINELSCEEGCCRFPERKSAPNLNDKNSVMLQSKKTIAGAGLFFAYSRKIKRLLMFSCCGLTFFSF